jgi:hypothetical protein
MSNAPGNVGNWLNVLWNIMSAGVAQTPGQSYLNFLAPFTVTANPSNACGAGSFDVTFNPGAVTPVVLNVATAGTTQLPNVASNVIAGDANAGAQTFNAPLSSLDGYTIDFTDASATSGSSAISGTNTVSFTDPNGYLFQDPDHPTVFHATYTITTSRNLGWRRVTCARTSTTIWGTK